jgi:hypothetical protein
MNNNIIPLRPENPEAAALLLALASPIPMPRGRKRFVKDLPDILEIVLRMLLADVDASRATSATTGCRVLASCIAQLKN